MTALITVGFIVLIVVVVATGKRVGDRILDEILNAELREIDRRRQAGIESGFTAGWHGTRGRW